MWFLSSHYIRYEKYEAAKILLETILAEGMKKIIIMKLLKVNFKLEQYKNVEEILINYDDLYETDFENYYLGVSSNELKKFNESIPFLQSYVKHYPTNYTGYIFLGNSYYMEKKYELALKAYKDAEKLNPTKQGVKDNIEFCVKMMAQSN